MHFPTSVRRCCVRCHPLNNFGSSVDAPPPLFALQRWGGTEVHAPTLDKQVGASKKDRLQFQFSFFPGKIYFQKCVRGVNQNQESANSSKLFCEIFCHTSFAPSKMKTFVEHSCLCWNESKLWMNARLQESVRLRCAQELRGSLLTHWIPDFRKVLDSDTGSCVRLKQQVVDADHFLPHSITTLIAPSAPVRAVSNAARASSSGKWCVTSGLAFTFPEAIMDSAVGYLSSGAQDQSVRQVPFWLGLGVNQTFESVECVVSGGGQNDKSFKRNNNEVRSSLRVQRKQIITFEDMFFKCAYVLAYLKMPRMSTSRTAAFTMGSFTSAGPSPTRTSTPPDLVACTRRNSFPQKAATNMIRAEKHAD